MFPLAGWYMVLWWPAVPKCSDLQGLSDVLRLAMLLLMHAVCSSTLHLATIIVAALCSAAKLLPWSVVRVLRI